jgi:hypothetical protein
VTDIPAADITALNTVNAPTVKESTDVKSELVDLDDLEQPPAEDLSNFSESDEPGSKTAPLPRSILDREQNLDLKPRYKGHSPLNDLVRKDWVQMIEQDPDSFNALLYRPVDDVLTNVGEDGLETPLFTELNNNQKELTYSDPEVVTVLDCPDERESFVAVDSDGDQDGSTDDFLVIRAATTGVAIGSTFEWNEELLDGRLARRFWYVLRIYTYGTASVGSLYYCIPAKNFTQSALGESHEQH